MSWARVGKDAKKQGFAPHRDDKRTDPAPTPPKPPGKAGKKVKVRKRFGFTYRSRYVPDRTDHQPHYRWHKFTDNWYATARQRDDAMRAYQVQKKGHYEFRDVVAVERT